VWRDGGGEVASAAFALFVVQGGTLLLQISRAGCPSPGYIDQVQTPPSSAVKTDVA
jgi:hypothetical protein